MRIPWTVIGFLDPSVHGIYDFVHCGVNTTVVSYNVTDDLFVEAVLLSSLDPRYTSSAFLNGGAASLAASDQTLYVSPAAAAYWWDPWLYGCYCERYKANATVLASFFSSVARAPLNSTVSFNRTAISLPPGYQFCEGHSTCTCRQCAPPTVAPSPPPPPQSLAQGGGSQGWKDACGRWHVRGRAADLTLGQVQQYLVLGGICFIYVNMVWIAFIRPVIFLLLNLCVRLPSHSNPYAREWAACCGHTPLQPLTGSSRRSGHLSLSL